MPLIKSASNEARQSNIKEMLDAGHPANVAVAASYANQREAARKDHHSRQDQRNEHDVHRYGRRHPY